MLRRLTFLIILAGFICFSVPAFADSLTVDVSDIPSYPVTSDGKWKLSLQNEQGDLVASPIAEDLSEVIFDGLPSGEYLLSVANQGASHSEWVYWGASSVIVAGSTSLSFQRNMPWVQEVAVGTPTVDSGATVSANITVKNEQMAWAVVALTVRLGRGQEVTSSEILIPPGESKAVSVALPNAVYSADQALYCWVETSLDLGGNSLKRLTDFRKVDGLISINPPDLMNGKPVIVEYIEKNGDLWTVLGNGDHGAEITIFYPNNVDSLTILKNGVEQKPDSRIVNQLFGVIGQRLRITYPFYKFPTEYYASKKIWGYDCGWNESFCRGAEKELAVRVGVYKEVIWDALLMEEHSYLNASVKNPANSSSPGGVTSAPFAEAVASFDELIKDHPLVFDSVKAGADLFQKVGDTWDTYKFNVEFAKKYLANSSDSKIKWFKRLDKVKKAGPYLGDAFGAIGTATDAVVNATQYTVLMEYLIKSDIAEKRLQAFKVAYQYAAKNGLKPVDERLGLALGEVEIELQKEIDSIGEGIGSLFFYEKVASEVWSSSFIQSQLTKLSAKGLSKLGKKLVPAVYKKAKLLKKTALFDAAVQAYHIASDVQDKVSTWKRIHILNMLANVIRQYAAYSDYNSSIAAKQVTYDALVTSTAREVSDIANYLNLEIIDKALSLVDPDWGAARDAAFDALLTSVSTGQMNPLYYTETAVDLGAAVGQYVNQLHYNKAFTAINKEREYIVDLAVFKNELLNVWADILYKESVEYGQSGSDPPSGVTVTSGPSLPAEHLTDSSAIINWSTSKASSGKIEYGLDSSLGLEVSVGSLVSDHSLALTGLAPGTKYYFRLSGVSEDLESYSTSIYKFTTQPGSSHSVSNFQGINLTQAGAPTQGPLCGVVDISASFDDSSIIRKVEFFYSADLPDVFFAFGIDESSIGGWNASLNTIERALGKSGPQDVHIKVRTTLTNGTIQESVQAISVDNVSNIINAGDYYLYFLKREGQSIDPSVGNFDLSNMRGSWTLLSKSDFIKVYDSPTSTDEINTGDSSSIQTVYVKIDQQKAKSYGTHSGDIKILDETTQVELNVEVVYIHAEKGAESSDIELIGMPRAFDAVGGNRIYPPFVDGQTVYWQLRVKNNGPNPIESGTDYDLDIGLYVNNQKYSKVGDTPPSYEMRAQEADIEDLTVGLTREIYLPISFTAADVGRDLYMTGFADWNREIPEGGSSYESNNYASFGPFRVKPKPNPDFDIRLLEKGIVVKTDGTAIGTLAISSIDGFSDSLALSLGTLANGLSASLGVLAPSPGQQVELQVVASSDISPGSYSIPITAVGGGKTHIIQVPVVVIEGVAPELGITTNAGQTFISDEGVVTLEGTSSDLGSGVAYVTINSGQVNAGTNGNWQFEVSLLPGANTFVVTAVDVAGNVTTQTIEIYSPPTELSVSPQNVGLGNAGDAIQLTATAKNASGAERDYTDLCFWTSDDDNIAIVTASGELRAVADGSATITAMADGVPATCSVSVDSTLRIGTSLTSISTVATEGLNSPFAIPFEIWNAGGGHLSWQIIENTPWMHVDTLGGVSSGMADKDKIVVSFDTSRLPAGEYTSQISIVSDGAENSPFVLPVTLTVNAPNPYLQILYPKDQGKTPTLTPILCWSGIGITGKYTVKVFSDPLRNNLVHSAETTEQFYQIPESVLSAEAAYYWNVTAFRNGETITAASQAFVTPTVDIIDVGGSDALLYTHVIAASEDATVGIGGDANSDVGEPSTNYGSLRRLLVGVDSGFTYSSYVNFDLDGVLPLDATISEVWYDVRTMSARSSSTGYSLGEVQDSWTEETVTWNNKPSASSIGSSSSSDIFYLPSVDVKTQFLTWLASPSEFKGLKMESTGGQIEFCSREGGLPPTLTVSYYFDPAKRSAISSVVVDPAPSTHLQAGDQYFFSAVAKDEQGVDVADVTAFHWEVLPISGDGSIDQDGLFRAERAGTCLIKASAYGYSAVTSIVTIEPGAPVSLTITGPSPYVLSDENPTQLHASGTDAFGNKTTEDISWSIVSAPSGWTQNCSSEECVPPFVNLTGDGIITASGDTSGESISIKATHSGTGLEAQALIQNVGSQLAAVEVAYNGELRLPVGQQLQFQATGIDGSGSTIEGVTLQWGVEGSDRVASIDDSGLVTLTGNGTFYVKASCGSVSGGSVLIESYYAKPGAFNLAVPEVSEQDVSINTSFSWEASGQAEHYRFELKKWSGLLSEVVVSTVITGTGYSFGVPLEFGTEYSWKVTAINGYGETESTESRSFTTEQKRVTAIYWPTDDAYVHNSASTTNYGNSDTLVVQDHQRRKALIKFDPSELRGREILSARLELYQSSATPAGDNNNIQPLLYTCEAEWNEEDVAWNKMPPIGSTNYSRGHVETHDNPKNIVFYGLAELVQGWIDEEITNNGICIQIVSNHDQGSINFASKEHSKRTYRPRLIIEYRGELEDAENAVGALFPPTVKRSIIEYGGSYSNIVAGGGYSNGNQRRSRALLKYDLQLLPEDIDVSGSSVLLNHVDDYFDNERSASFYAHRVTKPWTRIETWGSFGIEGYDPVAVGQISSITNEPETYESYYLDVLPLVNSWLSGSNNYGLMLKSSHDASTGGAVRKGFEDGSLLVFYTWNGPPKIESIELSSFENGVNPFTRVEITFNKVVDQNSVEGVFQLLNGDTVIEGHFEWSVDGRVLYFIPNAPLDGNVTYTVTVGDTFTDLSSNSATEGFDFNFSTASTNEVPYLSVDKTSILYNVDPLVPSSYKTQIEITNTNQGTMDWELACDAIWLSFDKTKGLLGPGASTVVTVEVDSSNVSPDTLRTEIIVICDNTPNSPAAIDVTRDFFEVGFEYSLGSTAEANNTVTFSNQTSGSVVSYLWEFGDGSSSTDENPIHVYQNSGWYVVSLTAIDIFGSTHTSFKRINVGNSYEITIEGSSFSFPELDENNCKVEYLSSEIVKLSSSASTSYDSNRRSVIDYLFSYGAAKGFSGVTSIKSFDRRDNGRFGFSYLFSCTTGLVTDSDWGNEDLYYTASFKDVGDNDIEVWMSGFSYVSSMGSGYMTYQTIFPENVGIGRFGSGKSSGYYPDVSDFDSIEFLVDIWAKWEDVPYYKTVYQGGYGLSLVPMDPNVKNMRENLKYRADCEWEYVDYFSDYNIPAISTVSLPPHGFSARRLDSYIELTWIDLDEAQKNYTLVRSTSSTPQSISDGEIIYTGQASQYVDMGVVSGIEYFYSLFIQEGNFCSNPSSISQQSTTPTPEITTLASNGLRSRIDLSWKYPTDIEYEYVKIFRKTGSAPTDPYDSNAELIYDGIGTRISDYSVEEGINYHYTIFLYNSGTGYSRGKSTSSTLEPPKISFDIFQLAHEMESITLELKTGYNLVSFPVFLEDQSISLLTDIPEIESIETANKVYNFADNHLLEQYPLSAGRLYELKRLEPGRGYWIKVSAPVSLPLSGQVFYAGQLSLNEKQTCLPWLSTTSTLIMTAFSTLRDLDDELSALWRFNTDSQQWETYRPDLVQNSLTNFFPTLGYLFNKEDSASPLIWSFENPKKPWLSPSRTVYADVQFTPDVEESQVLIDWGDYSGLQYLTESRKHTYAEDGEYHIMIFYDDLVVTRTMNVVSSAPVLGSTSVQASEDTNSFTVISAQDSDNDYLNYALVTPPEHGTVVLIAGQFVYTPDADYNGPDSFTYSATDSSGHTTTSTVQINVASVNDAPTAASQSVSTNEDVAVGITLSGTDVDGLIASYAVTQQPSHGTLSGTAPNLTYTPNENFNGSDSFQYTVYDGALGSEAATVSIAVAAVNDQPTANGQSVSTNEDVGKGIVLAGSDPEGASLTYVITQVPQYGTLSGTAPNLTYTPHGNYNGFDSFKFIVNDGTIDSEAATISVDVAAVNDAPTATSQSVVTSEDVPATFSLNISDVDDTIDSYVLVSGPSHGTLSGTPSNLTYTPATNYYGADSFAYKVSDGQIESDTVSVSISVTAVNDKPVASAQSVTLNEDSSKQFTLIGSDVENGHLSASIVTQPSNGTLIRVVKNCPPGSFCTSEVIPANTYKYIPDEDYNGSDSFQFKMSDGELDSETVTVSITVLAVNDVPVGDNKSVAVNEDGSVTITLSGSDVDLDVLSQEVVEQPQHGTLSSVHSIELSFCLGGDSCKQYKYTPSENYSGPDKVVYRLWDGTGWSSNIEINITVAPVNDKPVAVSFSESVLQGSSTVVVLMGSDVEDASIDNYEIVIPPAFGTLSGTAPNIIYTPNTGFSGPDQFSYLVIDSEGADSDPAVVNITVQKVDADDDSMEDVWEMTYFGNLNESMDGDFDNDGLTNYQEFIAGTNPTLSDTDGDGLPDGWEHDHGSDPLVGDANGDADGDGTSNIDEFNDATGDKPLIMPAIQLLLLSDASSVLQ